MTDWFRSWHGAPTDNKWLLIARKANVAPGVVSAVVWALLDYASQQADRGDVSHFDVETYATFSGFSEEQIEAVIQALTEKQVIYDSRLTAWEKRQPKREDHSTERVAAHRKRNETQCNATQRTETLDTEKRREEEKREEKKEDIRAVAVATRPRSPSKFEGFWQAYPKRDGANPRKPAEKKFIAAVKSGADPEAIIAGARRYAAELRSKGEERTPFVAQAVTWLNQGRWNDYPPPTAVPQAQGPPQPPSPELPSDAELREKYRRLNDAQTDRGDEVPPSNDGAGEGMVRACASTHSAAADERSWREGDSEFRSKLGGIQSLGSVLPRTLGRLAPVRDASLRDEAERSRDDAGPVARVV